MNEQRPGLRAFRPISWLFGHRRQRPNAVVNVDDPVGGAISDAEVLLAFSVQSRRGLKKERVHALNASIESIRAKRRASEVVGADLLSEFWIAYDELAIDAAPVSAQSIRESMAFTAKVFPVSLFTPTAINAVIAIGVFLICIALQGFWSAGRELLAKADTLDAQKLELQQKLQLSEGAKSRRELKAQQMVAALCPPDAVCGDDGYPIALPTSTKQRHPLLRVGKEEEARLRAELKVATDDLNEKRSLAQEQFAELQRLSEGSRQFEGSINNWHRRAMDVCRFARAMCPISADSNPKPKDGSVRIQRLNAELEALQSKTNASAGPTDGFLRSASERQKKMQIRAKEQEIDRENERLVVDQFRDKVQQIRLVLASFGNYWIPMFMGLLGALAFILRSLTVQLRDHTYVPASSSVSVVRMCLGAVAGVFGSLLAPASEGALKGLPPLFIPFVFGYGIEILFSVMDRVVTSFTQSERATTGVKPPT